MTLNFDKESNIISKDHWSRGEQPIQCYKCIRYFVCLNCWLFNRWKKVFFLNCKYFNENIFNFYQTFKNPLKYKTLIVLATLNEIHQTFLTPKWKSPVTWYWVEYLRVISLGWWNMIQCELSGCKSITPTILKKSFNRVNEN